MYRGIPLRPIRMVRSFFAPVDISSLVVFRVVFGLCMFWLTSAYYTGSRIAALQDPVFRFPLPGFEWLPHAEWIPLPTLVVLLRIASLGIAFGLLYRVCAAFFFLGFTHIFLIDVTFYQNHFYLISLMSLLVACMPAHRRWSIDALLRKNLRADTAPAWCVQLLRFQFAVAYFYAGVAKINPDWFRGEPLRALLTASDLGQAIQGDAAILAMSYAGLIFDLLVAPLLYFRKTRLLAYNVSLVFHFMNSHLWRIDVFPYFMIGATLIFFDPDWPKQVYHYLRTRKKLPRASTLLAAPHRLKPGQRALAAVLVIYMALQTALPLRAVVMPGPVLWTEQGRLYSWRMMSLRRRSVTHFFAEDPATGRRWELNLADFGVRVRPYPGGVPEIMMPRNAILFAHHAARELEARGYDDVRIYAEIWSSLNRRRPQLLIEPDVNLAEVDYSPWSNHWIRELTEPLPSTPEERESARAAWLELGGIPRFW